MTVAVFGVIACKNSLMVKYLLTLALPLFRLCQDISISKAIKYDM